MTDATNDPLHRPSPAAQARLVEARTFVESLPTHRLPEAAAWRGRLRTTVAGIRSAWRPWFELAHRHTLALRTAMTLSDHVWQAEQGADEPGDAESGSSKRGCLLA